MSTEPLASNTDVTPPTFHGSHTRKVDAKGRFHLPFQFRPPKAEDEPEDGESREKYMLSPGPDGSAALSPYAVWLDRFNDRPEGLSKREHIRNQRLMSLNSHMLIPDKHGRVALPAKVKEALGVDKEVVVVGMGLHMEVWSADRVVGGGAADQMPSDDYLYDFFG
ncbi:hypothetical protein CSB20_02520 [bacterium DOLZORAL124_64_63]|nr:MAG: hypothetical protein CSB20_02520 [bacterium DOLZORAL124_64_63]